MNPGDLDLRHLAPEAAEATPIVTGVHEEIVAEGLSQLPQEQELRELPPEYHRMNPKQRLVCRYKSLGVKNKTIGAVLGYTPAYISTILHSPEGRVVVDYFSRKLDDNHEVVQSAINQKVLKAMERIVEVLDDDEADKGMQIRCAWDLLDRAGHKPPTVTKVQLSNGAITPEDLQRVRQMDSIIAHLAPDMPQLPQPKEEPSEQAGEAGLPDGG